MNRDARKGNRHSPVGRHTSGLYALEKEKIAVRLLTELLVKPANLSALSKYTAMNGIIYLPFRRSAADLVARCRPSNLS